MVDRILHQIQVKHFSCGTVDWAGKSGRGKVGIMDQITVKGSEDLDQGCLNEQHFIVLTN